MIPILAFVGAAFGGVEYWLTYSTANEISAPQLAALAASSLVYAIIPYVVARAWDEASRSRPVVALAPVASAVPKAA